MSEPRRHSTPGSSQSGFTLVEAIIAIVVLTVGLLSVFNLLVVARVTNANANVGTTAATEGMRRVQELRAMPYAEFAALTSGADEVVVPGIGTVAREWEIEVLSPQMRFVRVRASPKGLPQRMVAEYTLLRVCGAEESGCPAP